MDVMEQAEQVSVEAVYACISGTFNPDGSVRTPAEGRLKAWEEDASPGFLLALVKILEGCPDEVRLYLLRLDRFSKLLPYRAPMCYRKPNLTSSLTYRRKCYAC